MAKKVQLMTNAKEWQTVDGVEVLIDVPQEDLDPITDSGCVEIEGHRTLEETISQENMFTPEIVETKVHSKVGGVYHDNVVDGAYEEAILYGNTQVNLVESVTTDTKYIPHSFTSFQGNESKIGNYHSGRTNQVAPLVKGVTMVNLAQKTSVTIAEGHNGGAIENIKSNTKYTLALDFTVQNTQKGFSIQSFKDDTYLETSMIRTGMGEKIKFTFTTHEEANSIYIVNNSGYGGEIQLDNIMVIEGDVTDLDLPFFKGMRSVELSRPLTNLLHDGIYKTYGSTTQLNYSDGNVTVTANAIGTWQSANFHFINEDELKPNTKYIVMWDSLTQTQTSTSSGSIIAVYDTKSGDGNINIGTANSKSECPVLRSIVFDTTGRDASGIVLRIHATLSNSETGTTTVTGLRVFEWDDSLRTLDLQTIGYFSGTKYVSVRALETEGKNLYPYGDINFTPTSTGWFDAKGNGNMYGDIAQKSKCRFLLKKGTYKLSSDYYNRTNLGYMSLVTDKEEIIGDTTFTLDKDTYLTLRLQPVEANVATTLTNIQIEHGETATTYEAYQSRYYKPRETEEIILRSLPNGICDTFNLQTGELVQRVGEIVLDGSEYFDTSKDYFWYVNLNLSNENYTTFMLDGRDGKPGSSNFVCDKLANKPTWLIVETGVWADSAIVLTLPTSIVTTTPQLKEYLQTNQLRIQYELKEPIITKLQTYDRIYNGQTNALVGIGNNLSALTYRYSTDYLKVANLSPVPAILEPITSIPYNVRLKPSTLYTIKYSRGGYSNSMKFDLGGSVVEKTNSITDLTGIAEELTVKTPAILSHEQLILSGTGFAHNFIVVEGDITGTELPYFEGMKNVKMPIVRNCGKNLFDGNFTIGGLSTKDGSYDATNKDWAVTDYIKVYNMQDITFNSSVSFSMNNFVYFKYDINKKFLGYIGIYNSYTTASISLDDNVHYIRFRVPSAIPSNSKFQLEEGIQATSYEPYRGNDVCLVQGEIGLSQDMFEQGGFSGSSGNTYDNCKANTNTNIRMRTKGLITVKPNTTYVVNNNTSPNMNHVFYLFDESQKYLGSNITVNAKSFVTPNNCGYVSLMFSKNNNVNITVSEFNPDQFQLLELDSTINLRSLPNGVKDELNLLTGEYIQRVGEVVLDGSEEQQWRIGVHNNANLLDFYIHDIIPNALNEGNGISDKFNYVNRVWNIQVSGICVNMDKGVSMMLPTKYVKTQDLQGCLEWLQQNPVTLQYELAEPIISHVRLVSSNQEREVGVKLPNGVCNTYNPSTGITTVRVGKVVLDGSEDWMEGGLTDSSYYEGWLPNSPLKTMAVVQDSRFINGNFTVLFKSDVAIPHHVNVAGKKHLAMSVKNTNLPDPGAISILIQKSKMSTQDLVGFKAYLSQNPITVWYELKYPQIQPDIVLPNGVHDEYNPETGVYTKKVGFIEFDGSADEIWYEPFGMGSDTPTIYSTWTSEPLPNAKCASISDRIPGICNSLKFHNDFLGKCNFEMYFISDSGRFNLNIERAKLSSGTTAAFNQYLSQNPIKLWYELQTPITYQLTPYFGLPQPYAYEDGYLIHDSAYAETTLPPEFKYKLVANRTGQVMQNNKKLQEHTTRLSNLEAIIIEATIESLFNRELQLFELELMDVQLIDLGE